MIDDRLTGKEFEAAFLFRARKMEDQGILTMSRYGTTVVMMSDPAGVPRWQPVPSLPDMEGIVAPSGRQFVAELKVCSQSSYPIHQRGKDHPKQIQHMFTRARFGASCWLVIHFNARELKNASYPPVTYAIPVRETDLFWRNYASAEMLSVNRDDAELYGIEVKWNLYSERASKLTPDLSFLLA